MKSKDLDLLETTVILNEFRGRVYDLKEDDESLLRFLKRSRFNMDKAEHCLRETIQWRSEQKVSLYRSWTPPKPVSDDFRYFHIGQDHDGYAVFYIPIGEWQTKKVMEMGYKEEAFLFRLHLLEKLMDVVGRTKKTKFTLIMDMSGLTYKKCIHYDTIQFLGLTFKEFEDHYPERLRSCYVINAPWAFTYIYNALKHVFSSRTLNKARIFDMNDAKWRPILQDKIPIKVLNKIKAITNAYIS